MSKITKDHIKFNLMVALSGAEVIDGMGSRTTIVSITPGISYPIVAYDHILSCVFSYTLDGRIKKGRRSLDDLFMRRPVNALRS